MNHDYLIPGNGMKLCLEVIVASLNDNENLRYFVLRQDITEHGDDPDDLVLGLLDAPANDHPAVSPQKCIIHSTSWRFERQKTIVLTYLVYSDCAEFRDSPVKLLSLRELAITSGKDPARPRPLHIAEEHVVAHGIRHISHLIKQDNRKMRELLAPRSLRVFQEMSSLLAGRLC
jgi:hypothetical protein